MKLVLWVLTLFAAAAAVVIAAQYDHGSVLFVVPPYKIELTINIFIIVLIAAFFLFYLLLRLLANLFGLHRKRINESTLTATKAFFEARFDKAEKAAASVVKSNSPSTISAINAVIAARSAHKQANYSQRDHYLAISEQKAPEEKELRLVTQAELLLEEERYEEALKALQTLYSEGGLQSTSVLQLELKAQQLAQNWDAVLELASILEKRHSVNRAAIEQIKHHAHIENIKKNGAHLESLNKYWNSLSPAEKLDSRLAATAARAYMALGEVSMAQKIIEQSIDSKLDSELISLYAKCLDGSVSWQIQRAEGWLRRHPNNAELLLTLGKLCTYCELWGKAQNYLEASLSIEPSRAAHLALAQLFEKLEKHDEAADHYHKGLGFSLKKQQA
ncbi:MAG TPA: heme biosynthesis protein HemY [Nitrosomonas nitrosa]|jgi:HemY protein|uniref:HemY protein n=1 Tax=Nitrosomonas nitrosa TaxID=52442 RepID=A0A1I4PJ00_9PROT|nr:heme biosynthesis HemY N-terminal domain-containing protein [Nitrosomonas nitrosa]MCO6434046.1 heme biosynthesis protein HemY [Nitrosomonas nitrosa]PTR00223.1 HemY protein [Nitrosomonas nitrosa]CAE6508782.1 HemY protein [Nitrosomonas nitrosa]SFM27536.1 HemY protein [Nitrosomonas nitrosa]HBZ30256.1 heme biosynthesis protein HemY [Nitrosomonas nitrosa]